MGVILIPVSNPSYKCNGCRPKTTPLSIGLGVGIGVGIPLMCVFIVLICYFYNKKLNHKLKMSFNKKYNHLVKIIPDEKIRTNLERCIFHPDVIEYVSNLNNDEQDFIYKYIHQKHYKSKAQELMNWINIKNSNNEMNNKQFVKIVS